MFKKKGEQSKLQIATKFIETDRFQKLSKSRILNDLNLDQVLNANLTDSDSIKFENLV